MVFYCANHYADPRCHNNVPSFGDFCKACIESKRGWSMEALDGRTDSRTSSSDSVPTTQSTQKPLARDTAAAPAPAAYRNTSVTT